MTGLGTQMNRASSYLPDSNIYQPTATDASIRAAALAAYNAKGGVVLLPAGLITLTAPLQLYDNVEYRGAGIGMPDVVSILNTSGAQAFGFTPVAGSVRSSINGGVTWSGTVLQGDGTFNCFEYNPTDKVSAYASGPALKASELTGPAIKNLGIFNFKFGIKCGAKYEGGATNFNIDNVIIDSCVQWGAWFENCQSSDIGSITILNCGVGGFAYGGSGTSFWNYGNSVFRQIFVQQSVQAPKNYTTNTTRGILFFARGASSRLNDCVILKAQANGNSITTATTQTATFTSGNVNIAVTDLSKYAVDNAIKFNTAPATNFNQNQPYFIISQSAASGAGTIQLSATEGGVAINPGSSTTATASTRGGTGIAFVGNFTDSATVTSCAVYHTDIEANGTIYLLAQSTSGNLAMDVYDVFTDGFTYAATGLTGANTICTMRGGVAGSVYLGSGSYETQLWGTVPTNYYGNYGMGVSHDITLQRNVIRLSGAKPQDVWSEGANSGASPVIAFSYPLRHTYQWFNTSGGTHAWTFQNGEDVVGWVGSTAGYVVTLPLITADMLGVQLTSMNSAVAPAVSITLTGNSGQTIKGYGASATTYVQTTLTTRILTAMNDGTGTYYWGICG